MVMLCVISIRAMFIVTFDCLFSLRAIIETKEAWTIDYPRLKALRLPAIADKSTSTHSADAC